MGKCVEGGLKNANTVRCSHRRAHVNAHVGAHVNVHVIITFIEFRNNSNIK